jgi:hypothetical protein
MSYSYICGLILPISNKIDINIIFKYINEKLYPILILILPLRVLLNPIAFLIFDFNN